MLREEDWHLHHSVSQSSSLTIVIVITWSSHLSPSAFKLTVASASTAYVVVWIIVVVSCIAILASNQCHWLYTRWDSVHYSKRPATHSYSTTRSALGVLLFQVSENSVHPFLILNVVYKCLAENPAHGLQMGCVKMEARVDPFAGPHETALKSEGVNQVELSPHHYSSAGLLWLLDCKAAIFKTEHIWIFIKQPTGI